MPYVLVVPALKLRAPVAVLIRVKADYLSLHMNKKDTPGNAGFFPALPGDVREETSGIESQNMPSQSPAIGWSPGFPNAKTRSAKPFVFEFLRKNVPLR